MAYLGVGLNIRYNFRFKNAPEPQNGGNFENFEIFEIHFDIRYAKNVTNYCIKSVFDVHDVTNDVTALRQNVPSIFMFK